MNNQLVSFVAVCIRSDLHLNWLIYLCLHYTPYNPFLFYLYNKSKIMISNILITIIALLHFYFLYLEMFAWETAGKKAFKGAMPDEMFKPTKTLAANQGLYNGFLAAGLIWSLLIKDKEWHTNVAMFFLTCVLIAGLYGAATASRKILIIQAVPAFIALLSLIIWN